MEKDIEKSSPGPASQDGDIHHVDDVAPKSVQRTRMGRFVDSFRRNPEARMVTVLTDDEGKPLPDQPPAEPPLAMKLKGRHLQMIAIGGAIGMVPPPLESRPG